MCGHLKLHERHRGLWVTKSMRHFCRSLHLTISQLAASSKENKKSVTPIEKQFRTSWISKKNTKKSYKNLNKVQRYWYRTNLTISCAWCNCNPGALNSFTFAYDFLPSFLNWEVSVFIIYNQFAIFKLVSLLKEKRSVRRCSALSSLYIK